MATNKEKKTKGKKPAKPQWVTENEERMTFKQRLFTKAMVKHKNATESALEVYNTDSREVAGSIGSKNIRKDYIKDTIDYYLGLAEYSPEDSVNRLIATAEKGTANKATASDQIKADKLLLQLSGAVIHRNQSVNVNLDYSSLSKSELLKKKKQLDNLIDD